LSLPPPIKGFTNIQPKNKGFGGGGGGGTFNGGFGGGGGGGGGGNWRNRGDWRNRSGTISSSGTVSSSSSMTDEECESMTEDDYGDDDMMSTLMDMAGMGDAMGGLDENDDQDSDGK